MLVAWAWCGVGDLPAGANALLEAALVKGWVTAEEIEAYTAKINDQ